MQTEIKVIHLLEKAVVLGVTSLAWSFICYLMVLAYKQSNCIALITLLLGLISLMFIFFQGVIDIAETYNNQLYKKYGVIKAGLICIAVAYMALLPPAYTFWSLLK